jgi:hypothetical protein
MASRRLRELLPVLQLDGPTVERLAARLRRVSRRLGAARQSDALLSLLDELDATERRGRQATARVRDDVQRLATGIRADLFRRKIGNEVRRASDKLASMMQTLKAEPDTRVRLRAMQWAVKARVARRAAELKAAISAAGSVYLSGRLKAVCVEARKLRFGADLAAEMADSVAASDVRVLARLQSLLDQLDAVQALIDRVRHVQGSLATPDLKAWRDLDALIISLETRCRGLHARYVRDRTALIALCDRLVARAPVDGSAKRKVS